MKLTLSSLYCHSEPNQDAALVHLDFLPLHDLVIWTDDSVPFYFNKKGSGVSPIAYFVALRPPFPFRLVQFVQVFPLKPVPFCKLSAGFGNSNKPAILLLLLLSDSRSILATLFSPPSFLYLKLSGTSGRSYILSSPLLSGYNGSPDIYFFRGTTWLMSWPDGERYSCLLQYLVVSLLLSLVSTLLFSRIGGVLSPLNSSTHRFS